MSRRSVVAWSLRLAALGLVVWVLASQLRWDDRLTLADGTVLVGRVERLPSGGWLVHDAGEGAGSLLSARPEDVATRGEGPQAVPDVAWGLRTLGRRLAGAPTNLFVVLSIFAFLLAMTAWRWRLLMRAVDLDLPISRAVRLTWIGAFFNMAIPGATGGDVVKAYYAARTTGRGTRSVISVFVDRAVGLLGLAVFAGGALLVAGGESAYGPARTVVLLVLGGAVVALVVVATPFLRRGLGLGRAVRRLPFPRLVAEARAALRLYKDRPLALLGALGVSLVNHGAVASCAWLLARALGIQGLDVSMALALVPIANLFSAVPLVPGGWGIGELAFAWLFAPLGIAPTEAVGLSVVYRLSLLVVSLPGGLLWLFWRGRPTKAAILHEVEAATHRVEVQEGLGAPDAPGAAPP